MLLDGPLVSLGTTWGAISNGTTYVELDERGDVIAQATLPAAAGPHKHALVWNGQQVAAYLADAHVATFAADGSNLHEGSWLGLYPEGALRATATGYAAVSTRYESDPPMVCDLDDRGALVGAPCPDASGQHGGFRSPVALTRTDQGPLVVGKLFCGGPGPGDAYCVDFAGFGRRFVEFHALGVDGLGLDADDDGARTVAVAFGAPPVTGGTQPNLSGAAWTITGGNVQPVTWSTSRPLSVAWTGSFWETIALSNHGTIVEERLDRDLHVTSSRDLTEEINFVGAPVVVSSAHGALIVLRYATHAQTMMQVCY